MSYYTPAMEQLRLRDKICSTAANMNLTKLAISSNNGWTGQALFCYRNKAKVMPQHQENSKVKPTPTSMLQTETVLRTLLSSTSDTLNILNNPHLNDGLAHITFLLLTGPLWRQLDP
jgi:hypothetical protein